MKIKIALFILLTVISSKSFAVKKGDSLGVLAEACEKAEVVITTRKLHNIGVDDFNSGFCIGIMKSAMIYLDILSHSTKTNFQLPKKLDTYKFIRAFVNWSQNKKHRWNNDMYVAIADMVAETYPKKR